MIVFIIRASNILRVDEFQLFNLAYQSWYDQQPELNQINDVFSHYVRNKTAPYWVIHFSRSVLQAYQSGNFDPARFGVHSESKGLPMVWSLIFKIRWISKKADYTLLA